MGDFGSATEAMRIIDLFALQVFAKNLDRCNFRVLQHNLPTPDIELTGSRHQFNDPLRVVSAGDAKLTLRGG